MIGVVALTWDWSQSGENIDSSRRLWWALCSEPVAFRPEACSNNLESVGMKQLCDMNEWCLGGKVVAHQKKASWRDLPFRPRLLEWSWVVLGVLLI